MACTPSHRRLRLGATCWLPLPQSQEMADRVHEIGAVERVEVKLLHALVHEIHDLLCGDRGSDEMARRRVALQSVETPREPGGNACAGLGGKARDLLEIVDRHDAGRDRHPDAGGARTLQETQVV